MRGGGSTGRVLMAMGVGIAVGILATFLLENDMLAVVLGSVAAVGFADASGGGLFGLVGLVAGAGVGLFLGARGDAVLSESLVRNAPARFFASLAATMIVSGLVGAVYGFISGEAKKLYDEGRGPFF